MDESGQSSWPIVVGGCPRSGTSLVRRILDSHSRIYCGPELKFLPEVYGDGVADPLAYMRFMPNARTLVGSDALLDALGPGFVELHERGARAAGKPRWADKVPENVLHWRAWQRLLGERWLLVHVVRNPLDTITSLREARHIDAPSDLTGQIVHYRKFLEAGGRFRVAHPERYHLVVYEQLVAQPDATAVALMEAVAETFEPQQLRFNEQHHTRGLEDRKIDRTTAIHRHSLQRWRDVLSRADAELIWDLTYDLWAGIDPETRFVSPPLG